jgi:hypothetical protein
VDIADQLAGKLLLIHGEVDDQVHPDHTLRLVDRLIAADKDFELLIVPGPEHMFIDCLHYVRKRAWDFLVRELMGTQPPAYRPAPSLSTPNCQASSLHERDIRERNHENPFPTSDHGDQGAHIRRAPASGHPRQGIPASGGHGARRRCRVHQDGPVDVGSPVTPHADPPTAAGQHATGALLRHGDRR